MASSMDDVMGSFVVDTMDDATVSSMDGSVDDAMGSPMDNAMVSSMHDATCVSMDDAMASSMEPSADDTLERGREGPRACSERSASLESVLSSSFSCFSLCYIFVFFLPFSFSFCFFASASDTYRLRASYFPRATLGWESVVPNYETDVIRTWYASQAQQESGHAMPNVPFTKTGSYPRIIYKPSNQVTLVHLTFTQMATFARASVFLLAFHDARTGATC